MRRELLEATNLLRTELNLAHGKGAIQAERDSEFERLSLASYEDTKKKEMERKSRALAI